MMQLPPETDLWIDSEGVRLAGRLRPGSGTMGVVIAHPHPLYGGSMDNPVVTTVATSYARSGYTTLRFDFRGVGRSSGRFDQGDGEVCDMVAAAASLMDAGCSTVALAGYSFGAWISVRALSAGYRAHHATLISPPVAMLAFPDSPAQLPETVVLVGDADSYAPLDAIREWAATVGVAESVKIASGADHFWSGGMGWLVSEIEAHLQLLSAD